ncbi:hypothetical protein MUU53_22835 [Rhizobium lemnae]|uniref:Resolvase/invertase-type recombinase catalytic domain-containing protein n=1 Tax=Rhizobium lemnae TaxID=1214924 RepID=A0ABV8ECN5_9HYPH|nr:hypothetical protein [Rhizobium lemnae]MCJ8510683.1 hypothetical protein [Rhizobium lemnae]
MSKSDRAADFPWAVQTSGLPGVGQKAQVGYRRIQSPRDILNQWMRNPPGTDGGCSAEIIRQNLELNKRPAVGAVVIDLDGIEQLVREKWPALK